MRLKNTLFPAFILLLLIGTSCGSQRKNPISKAYHNTTSHFNWYYNAERVWKEGVTEINSKFRVPAEGFIGLQYYGDENTASASFPKFDESIKKCEVIIFKHPNGKWIDNSRYLIGRNWFYKKNYYLAAQNFENVIDKYPKSKIRPDVYLWLARTYYLIDRDTEAEKIIKEKLKAKTLTKKRQGELAMMQADSYVKGNEYDRAVKVLEKNLKNIKGRLNKARTYFLLGQLLAEQRKLARAYDYFKKVSKMNTEYELIFNSKIRSVRLLVEQQAGKDDANQIARELKKMIRDEKNVDYKDQLYYELALLDLKKDNYTAAISHLSESVKSSTNNARQKALSYFLEGKIYFYNLADFDKAQAYFDSASTQITKTDPQYLEISTIGASLNEYVKNKRIVHYQDSMLGLSNLSKPALDARIDQIIEDEKRAKEQEESNLRNGGNQFVDPNLNDPFAPKASGGFYFDDPAQVSAARLEFQRAWGQRANEDNWRRKNKEFVFANKEEEVIDKDADSALVEKYGKKYKYYKDIPASDTEREWANEKIKDAMFAIGQIFDKKLSVPDSAIAAYKRLVARYPDSEQALKARFALYHVYQKQDPYKADEYKDFICEKHPASIYCKLLKNEDISEQLYAAANELSSAYNALYMTYKSGEYETVINFSNFLLSKFNEGKEIPQVYYIRGLCFGELGNLDSLRANFMRLRKDFPKADVTPIASRTLDLMDNKSGSSQNNPPLNESKNEPDNTAVPENEKFKDFVKEAKPNERMFVVLLVDKDAITSNELKVKTSDFDEQFFQTEKLSVSIFFYQNKQHLVYISQFRTAPEAINYMKIMKGDSRFKALTETPGSQLVFISPTNFRVAYGNQRFADYYDFYDQVILPSVIK